jgi:hypothetical protein
VNTKFGLLLLIIGVSMSLSCLSGKAISDLDNPSSKGQALGSLTISSKVLGNSVFTPLFCNSGDRQYFLGGDFKDQSSLLVLRLVVDPLNGPAVRLFSSDKPFDQSVVFHRKDCKVFHFSLDSTGWRVNDVYDYQVTLQLDCNRDGESIRGSASTTHCH